MNKKILIFIIIFTLILLSCLTFVIISTFNKPSEEEPTKLSFENVTNNINNTLTERNDISLNSINTNYNEPKISPNAYITFYKYYKKCGHMTKEKIHITDNLVNLTEDELQKVYKDWQINKFTSSNIELYKEFEGSCGEHYLVKTTNGFITVYILNDDNSVELKETTNIAVKYLSIEDMNELENGVVLYGNEELNSYIENFE